MSAPHVDVIAWATTQDAPSALREVLLALSTAAAELAEMVGAGPLRDLHGHAGDHNVHGERQQKLDVVADELFRHHLGACSAVAAMASEEAEDVVHAVEPTGPYLVAFDPLDGSSNIDVNVSVGAIFSVLPAGAGPITADSFLQPGSAQVAAGFVVFGPSTQLVVSVGNGPAVFTLDRSSGRFECTRAEVTLPTEAREFAINASNRRRWDAPVQRWFDECLLGAEGPRGRDFNTRWIASLVAEVFRILTRGGVFAYPCDARLRDRGHAGRLRVLYELAPMAWLVEQAGGAASTGAGRILEIVPQTLHDRAPVFLGAREEVERIERYHREHAGT